MGLGPEAKEWLKERFAGAVTFDEPMSKHTSLKVGGPADAFIAPESPERLAMLVIWAEEHSVPYLVIGGGTNLLIKDSGIRGVVINMSKGLKNITREDTDNDTAMVSVLAGTQTHFFCRFAVENGLEGMNFAQGIPGTIGGGIVMNAGTAEGAMEDVVEFIQVN